MANPGITNNTGLPSYEDYLKSLVKGRQPVQDLGKNEFLQLLIAQMQYQDPLEPTTNTEYISQMAQFSNLELMESMSNSMMATQYYGFAGQYVYAEVRMDDGNFYPIYGVVSSVFKHDGDYWCQVDSAGGSYQIKASAISQVLDKSLLDTSNPLMDAAHLIGKEAKGRVIDDSAQGYREVEGVVLRVAVEDGQMMAYLKNSESGEVEKVPVSNIYDIREIGAEIDIPEETPPVEETEPPENETEPGDETDPGDDVVEP